jgi:lysophospholipase L1-like esterase
MSAPERPGRRAGIRRRLRHAALFASIVAAQFVMFEVGLRTWGGSEAGPSFQGLFEDDPAMGFRLKPHARVRFKTTETDAVIAINGLGVRDDEEIGPKPAGERRVLILGDSLVLSVQVPADQTFSELLETKLNAGGAGPRYRVVNGGVQGYGPIEELLFFRRLAAQVEPDLVIVAVFVGNDAEEALASRMKLERGAEGTPLEPSAATRLRRLLRRSMVWQILRTRIVSASGRLATLRRPEPPLQSYAANPAPRIADGLSLARRCVGDIDAEGRAIGARTAVALLPARFQVDDGDYGRLQDAVRGAGGELVRDAATTRFDAALRDVPVPRLDLLPAMRRTRPGPDLFYQSTVHLTPFGHRVVAEALHDFIQAEGLLTRRSEER